MTEYEMAKKSLPRRLINALRNKRRNQSQNVSVKTALIGKHLKHKNFNDYAPAFDVTTVSLDAHLTSP